MNQAVPQQGQPRPQSMGIPGQPLPMMPNGTGMHNPQAQPGMPNGAMQPGQPGQYVTGMVNGMQTTVGGMPGQQQGRPMHMQGQPIQYTGSPVMGHANPGAPGQQRVVSQQQQQQMMRPGMSMHPGAQQQGMMPGQMQMQPQPGQAPYGARPQSRAATPTRQPQQMPAISPRLIPAHIPDTWQNEFLAMRSQLNSLPEPHFVQLRAMAGLTEKDDLLNLSDDQKVR